MRNRANYNFWQKMPISVKKSIFWLFHKIKSAWPYLSENVSIRFLSLLDSRSDGIFFGWNNLEPGWHFENVWFIFFDILELISRRGSESIRLRVKRGTFSRNYITSNQSEYRFLKIFAKTIFEIFNFTKSSFQN